MKALQEGNAPSAIVSLLLAQYDVQPDEAEAEVTDFINMLKKDGLAE